MKKSKVVAALYSVILFTLIAAVAFHLFSEVSTPSAREALEQIGTALRLYASDAKGERYPPHSSEHGAFLPNLDSLNPYIDELENEDLVKAYLGGRCDVRLCYLGYFLPNHRTAMTLLDKYAELENSFDYDIPLDRLTWQLYDDPRSYDTTVDTAYIRRLREGVERFLITTIGDPSASGVVQGEIPILWEMPDEREVPGGWVVYMDGHTDWLPYPGNFPFTRPFISRVRVLMSTLPDLEPIKIRADTPARWHRPPSMDSPVHGIAIEVLDCLSWGNWSIGECDRNPSVEVDGHKGYRIRYSSGFELVLFPSEIQVGDDFKKRIWNREQENRTTNLTGAEGDRRSVFDLGTGHGFRWFALSNTLIQDNLRDCMGLVGGDDRLQSMIDADAVFLTTRIGPRAVPYLESIVTGDWNPSLFAEAVMALERIPGSNSDEIIRAAFALENENAFRNAESVISASSTSYNRRRAPLDSTLLLVGDALLRTGDQVRLTALLLELVEKVGPKGPNYTDGAIQVQKEIIELLPERRIREALDRIRSEDARKADRLEEILQRIRDG